MKIIKQGTPKSEEIWIGTCRSCKYEVEGQRHEMNNIQYDREGDFSWNKCPVCNVGPYGGLLMYKAQESL